MDLIEIKNLSYDYPTVSGILNKISFEIEKGTFTCIVGENGSGKSTLLKCILGLEKGYKGKIRSFGKELCGYRYLCHDARLSRI